MTDGRAAGKPFGKITHGDGLIISEQDCANFINQYKNSSDEGMRAWAELYKSDERTRRLSRIVF